MDEAGGDLAAELDAALSGGGLTAVFQPQISLASGRIVATEGLCRWQHPRLGWLSPDVFIPLAETTGAIHAIGQFMLDECFAAAETWIDVGGGIDVAVNVSPRQLTGQFASDLEQRWRERSPGIEALTLEITESLPLPHLAASLERLRALRTAGIGISLDDYGTGHASRDQLGRLPVTEVKLDKSLVQNHHDAATTADVAEVVDYAHNRKLRVVAEGVETDEQLRFARRVGCDRAQGYYVGTPTTRGQLTALLAG